MVHQHVGKMKSGARQVEFKTQEAADSNVLYYTRKTNAFSLKSEVHRHKYLKISSPYCVFDKHTTTIQIPFTVLSVHNMSCELHVQLFLSPYTCQETFLNINRVFFPKAHTATHNASETLICEVIKMSRFALKCTND